MRGVIPFVRPWIRVFGVTINLWPALVLLGITVGALYAVHRSRAKGLDPRVPLNWGGFFVASGFVFAHVFDVVFYRPELLAEDPWVLAPWVPGWSSMGGFFGAGLIIVVYFRVVGPDRWRHADTMALSFILGWTFGRAGCACAHDHLGSLAHGFPLAVAFPDGWPTAATSLGVRHDLGLYEAALSAAIFGLLWVLDRRARPAGLLSGLLLLTYVVPRFFLDFLRAQDLEQVKGTASDALYSGLTPAQWGCLALLPVGVWMTRAAVRRRLER